MKKTLTINLSGLVFHIDEDAYEKLKRYLNAIKKQYKKEARNEILDDVEARIAELFQEKLNNRNQVISLSHIEEVIEVLGAPEDFVDDGNYETDSAEFVEAVSYKRLYRDSDNRILGGVCSGLSHYLGIDVVYIRLVFILLLFVGVGPLLYLVLWIVTPEANTATRKTEMTGDPVDLNNIGRMVRDEFNDIKDRFQS